MAKKLLYYREIVVTYSVTLFFYQFCGNFNVYGTPNVFGNRNLSFRESPIFYFIRKLINLRFYFFQKLFFRMGLTISTSDRRLFDENGFEIWSEEACELRETIKRRRIGAAILTALSAVAIGILIAKRRQILNCLHKWIILFSFSNNSDNIRLDTTIL